MITVTSTFNATPHEVYEAWLSTDGHSAMTGSPAEVSSEVGGEFTAWDNYIWGTNLELVPDTKIIQSWRTTEFPDNAPDSELTIELEPEDDGTKVTITHSNVPPDQEASYEAGWQEHYFEPMQDYFG